MHMPRARAPRDREPMTVDEYLRLPVTKEKEELIFGFVVREPAPNFVDHDVAIFGLGGHLREHVTLRGLGVVASGNVILDEPGALVVVPDVFVILNDRLHLAGNHIWGPPNLAIEVQSSSRAHWDRTTKLGWYRSYGVQEYWIVDAKAVRVDVVDLTADPATSMKSYQGDDLLCSPLLPDFRPRVRDLLDDGVRTAIDRAYEEAPEGSPQKLLRYKPLPRRKRRKGDVR